MISERKELAKEQALYIVDDDMSLPLGIYFNVIEGVTISLCDLKNYRFYSNIDPLQ